MLKTKSVKLNIFLNVVLTITSLIFPLITFPYVSRILMPEGIGKVSFVQSFVSYFSTFAMLGVSTYGVKACAQVRDDKVQLSKTVHEILTILLVTTAIAYVALFICMFSIEKLKAEKVLVLVVSTSLMLTTIGMNWLFSAVEDYLYITVRSILFNVVSLVLMFVLIKDSSDYVYYGAISVIASGGSNVLNLFYSRKYVSYKRQKGYDFRRHIKPLIMLFGLVAITQIYTNLDKTMLGFMVNDQDHTVGIYETSVKIYRILTSVCTSVSAVLLPRLSYYIQNKENEKFNELLRQIMSFMLIFAIPVATYFIIMAKDCILFLADQQYIASIVPMKIMIPAIVFVSLTNIIGIQMLIPLGKENKVVISVAVGAAVDLLLNLLLINYFAARGNGAIATAISTLCAEFSVLVAQLIIARKYLKGIFKSLKWWRIILIDVLFFGVAFGTSFIDFNIEGTRTLAFARLAVTAVICVVAYVVILWVCKEPMLRDIVSAIAGKFKKKTVAQDVDGDGVIDGKDVVVEELNQDITAEGDLQRDKTDDEVRQNPQDQSVGDRDE